MNPRHRQIADIIAREGLIRRSEHPDLANQIGWLVRTGHLVPVLRDVLVPASLATDPMTRILALGHSIPDAVVLGDAAARVSYLPHRQVPVVAAALPYRRSDPSGYAFCQRSIPTDLVVERGGIRFSCPALTALELTDVDGGDAVDEVLRRRAATLNQLHQALGLTHGRRGHRRRRALLLDSRDEPWSAAERRFHRILRLLGYSGWRANHRVVIEGHTFFLDVAFRRARVVIEIDGRLAHSGDAAFESDRFRQNLLVLSGWQVIRFTWAMLDDFDLIARVLASALGKPHAALLDAS